MREWIDLVENKNRSYKNLAAKAQPFFEQLVKRCRSKKQPMMFRSVDQFVDELMSMDPTNDRWRERRESKYFDWLLRRFMEDPWMALELGWKGKRSWYQNFSRARSIGDALKLFNSGKVEPRDINAFKSFDQLIEAAKSAPKPKQAPFRMELRWKEAESGFSSNCQATVFIDGNDAGNFVIDFTHKAEKKVSVHAFLRKEYSGKGLGPRIYGWLRAKLEAKGYTLIPSDRLTDHAYNLWKKRDPASVEGYVRSEKNLDYAHPLWLSPYWQTVVLPKQEEMESIRAEAAKIRAEKDSQRQRYTLDQLLRGDDQKGLPPKPEGKPKAA